MESPSAQDRPQVEAQEDSSSVNDSPVSDDPHLSPIEPTESVRDVPRCSNDNVPPEDSTNQTETNADSSTLRADVKDSSIDSEPLELPTCSSDASAIPQNPENAEFSSNPACCPVDRTSSVEEDKDGNVNRVLEDNFFTDEALATSSSESTPSRKRPAGEFLPINAEIKRIGVEISEEHAQQLKNDIRRLSPILVSLRERTLGEISLTSDSGLFEDDVQSLRLQVPAETVALQSSECSHLTDDNNDNTFGAIVTDATLLRIDTNVDEFSGVNSEREASNSTSANKELAAKSEVSVDCEKSQVVDDLKNIDPAKDSSDGVAAQEIVNAPSTISGVSSNERPNVPRELIIVLSRVDDEGAAESTVKVLANDEISSNEKVDRVVVVVANDKIVDRTAAGCVVDGANIPENEVNRSSAENVAAEAPRPEAKVEAAKVDGKDYCSVLVGDFSLSPKYLGNDQLSRKSPKVVIERTLENRASPSTIAPESTSERSDALQRLNLDRVRKTLEDSLIDDTDRERVPIDPPAPSDDAVRLESPNGVASTASDLQESLDTETETETVSDSSELTSMASINLGDCVEPATGVSSCQESDSLPSDEVPSEIITRLEPERPEAFTEDSAESLALATGARDEVRSDGSDSGLGSEIPGDPGPTPGAPESDSETSFLDRIPDDILTDKDKAVNPLEAFVPDAGTSGTQQQQQQQIPLPSFPSPPKSSLKRRLSDCMEGEPSPKRINTEDPMRKKRNIQFDAVTVYYFPRAQGFTCVPSQGGSTLGMSATHTHAERYSLAEHATEQRRIHRARLAQLRSERAANCVTEAASSSEDPSDDTDEEPSDTEELDIDSYYFLQPVPTWQRRALLRAAGVRRIDAVEKDECRDIRASREHCGCGCKGYCDPESCPCSRANVKCQVDRAGFPCGCSRDGCANSSGRIEFNPVRVRTHFIHTLMRLQLEKKQRDEDRTDHELLLVNNQVTRGAIREIPGLMANPMDHPNVISGDPVSCINAGGFTTLHYESHEAASTSSCQPIVHGGREDSLDLYAIRDDCYPGEPEAVGVDGVQNSQRKLHPEFGQAFQTFPSQQPAVSFPQGAYHDYQGYQTLASTSRSPQFQPQFQALPGANQAAFSHYAYGQDPNVMQAACQPHPGPPPHHVYENSFPQEDPAGTQQQYTNLNSVQPLNSVVQQMGKLEPFSELLAGRYSYYGDVEPQPLGGYQQQQHNAATKIEPEKSQPIDAQPAEPATEDCDENFGEIIKKSMVETVSA